MVALQDAVRHIEDAPFVQLYLPGERTDMIHRHRVTEDFVQAPQVFVCACLPLQLVGCDSATCSFTLPLGSCCNDHPAKVCSRAATMPQMWMPTSSCATTSLCQLPQPSLTQLLAGRCGRALLST